MGEGAQDAFSGLPGSGHPLSSALGTEKACKRDREEKRFLAKRERRGKIEARIQLTGQRNHLIKRSCHKIYMKTNTAFVLHRKERQEVKLLR